MYVSNMISNAGNPVVNQFVITDDKDKEYFQSYDVIVATKKTVRMYVPVSVNRQQIEDVLIIELDEKYWDYSKTTSKYLSRFLGMTKKEIAHGIKFDGANVRVTVTNLNK